MCRCIHVGYDYMYVRVSTYTHTHTDQIGLDPVAVAPTPGVKAGGYGATTREPEGSRDP